jgi:hypothetical protein
MHHSSGRLASLVFTQALLIRASFKRMAQTQVICYCEFVALGGRGSDGGRGGYIYWINHPPKKYANGERA